MSDSIANGGCCSGSVRPGTYGDSTDVAQITVDKCGRITKISNVAISGGGGGSSQWTGTTGSPIYYVPNVGIGSSATPTAKLQVTGNIYVSNAITTKNVFTTGLYGNTGRLSNLVVSSNLYVANTFQVDNAFFANTTTVDMNFNTLTITYINTSNIVVSNLIASTGNIYMYGNVYVSNSLTSANVFATRYYGDGGLLSNISSSAITQPFANIVVSNSVTTTNVFASGYVQVANAVTTANVHVTDTLDVLGSMTANAANATFFFDTFTIPYINTQFLNVASNVIITGNLSVPSANITTLNVNYLTVNSAVVYGTNTLNVYGVSNLTNVFATQYYGDGGLLSNISSSAITQPFANLVVSNAVTTTNVFAATETLTGTAGATSLNVTGNLYASNAVTATALYGNVVASNVVVTPATGVTGINVTGNIYASNAVTTTNVYLTSGVTNSTSGQVVKGALEFNGTSNIFYGTSSTIRGLLPVQYFYELNADAGFGTTTPSTLVPAFPTMANGIQLQIGKYYMKMIYVMSITTSGTAGSTYLNMILSGGTATPSMTGCGVYGQNVTGLSAPGSTISGATVNTIFYNGLTTERLSAITTATNTPTYYYTTLEGTISITAPGGWYPRASITSPGTFTVVNGVRQGSFIYLQNIGDKGSDVNIGGWS